jgi:hypothetical protein
MPDRILSGDDKERDLEIAVDDFEEDSLYCKQESLTKSYESTDIFTFTNGT